jgi:glycosyltransferase involved in cell wall biosynthesis
MKIIHAVYSLEMGGAEVLVGQLCRIQRAQGHDVSVLAYAKLGVLGEALRDEGFPIHVPGEAHPLVTMARYFRIFRERKPDVVHCHNVAPTTHAAIPAFLAGVPSIISTRHRLELFPYNWKEEAQFNLMGWFCTWITGICEVTCVNIRKGPLARKSRIVLVYNGTSPVNRVADPPEKRSFTLLFVGRLVREKALDTLLRAVALALPHHPALDLWIVGDGQSRPELEALAQSLGLAGHVHFWGQQTDTAPFFSSADAFVMSSISEGLPMSLLQSMSLGTPAILTDVDGMGEVLRLTQSGLLVPAGDPAAFAEAILRLATNPALQKELSQCAAEAYQTRFTLEKMSEGYMALYRS